jgi:hypothetical protein
MTLLQTSAQVPADPPDEDEVTAGGDPPPEVRQAVVDALADALVAELRDVPDIWITPGESCDDRCLHS